MVASSIIVLFSVGLVAALVLGVASRIFHVEEDPRVEAVVNVLPGANCGGCGFAGCEGYAQAVVSDAKIAANLCVAGGDLVSVEVGNLTGKSVAASEPQTSYRRCEKVEGKVAVRFEYLGMPSCAAAAALGYGGGTDQCHYSCLGHGDCVRVCPFDALSLQDGMVRINSALCVGCGLCTKACPRNLLEIIPKRARVMVGCSSLDKGKAVTEICEAGCIKCGRCVKKCPAGAIRMEDKIYIDQTKCLSFGPECNQACVDSCARKILRLLCTPALAALEQPVPAEEEQA